MAKNNLKNKSHDELNKLVIDKTEALRVFRFNISGSKTKNVREGRLLRREIARTKTLLKK
ncbi:MAG TPA: 50S ribosomal protein L29 [Candidatus Paceibacterota bacterium]